MNEKNKFWRQVFAWCLPVAFGRNKKRLSSGGINDAYTQVKPLDQAETDFPFQRENRTIMVCGTSVRRNEAEQQCYRLAQ